MHDRRICEAGRGRTIGPIAAATSVAGKREPLPRFPDFGAATRALVHELNRVFRSFGASAAAWHGLGGIRIPTNRRSRVAAEFSETPYQYSFSGCLMSGSHFGLNHR